MTHRIADTELSHDRVAQAIESAKINGVATTITHEGQPVARIVPVNRPTIRPPSRPWDGGTFRSARPIKLRGRGSILDALDGQRR